VPELDPGAVIGTAAGVLPFDVDDPVAVPLALELDVTAELVSPVLGLPSLDLDESLSEELELDPALSSAAVFVSVVLLLTVHPVTIRAAPNHAKRIMRFIPDSSLQRGESTASSMTTRSHPEKLRVHHDDATLGIVCERSKDQKRRRDHRTMSASEMCRDEHRRRLDARYPKRIAEPPSGGGAGASAAVSHHRGGIVPPGIGVWRAARAGRGRSAS
jgi:hypothetical protein